MSLGKPRKRWMNSLTNSYVFLLHFFPMVPTKKIITYLHTVSFDEITYNKCSSKHILITLNCSQNNLNLCN